MVASHAPRLDVRSSATEPTTAAATSATRASTPSVSRRQADREHQAERDEDSQRVRISDRPVQERALKRIGRSRRHEPFAQCDTSEKHAAAEHSGEERSYGRRPADHDERRETRDVHSAALRLSSGLSAGDPPPRGDEHPQGQRGEPGERDQPASVG
jgi:hypothetical protein